MSAVWWVLLVVAALEWGWLLAIIWQEWGRRPNREPVTYANVERRRG